MKTAHQKNFVISKFYKSRDLYKFLPTLHMFVYRKMSLNEKFKKARESSPRIKHSTITHHNSK